MWSWISTGSVKGYQRVCNPLMTILACFLSFLFSVFHIGIVFALVFTKIWVMYMDKFMNISHFFANMLTFTLFWYNALVWKDEEISKVGFNFAIKIKDGIFIIRRSHVKRNWRDQDITIWVEEHRMDKKITCIFLDKDKKVN